MIILFGRYRFGLKKIGVRKDFCASCKRECVAEEWTSFDFFHFFYIPFIPLGRKRFWACTLCGQDPRRKPAINGLLKVLGGLILFLLIGGILVTWAETPKPGDGLLVWILRFLLPIVAVILVWLMFFRAKKPEPTIEERRMLVQPLSDKECFYCHGELQHDPSLNCPSCKINIY